MKTRHIVMALLLSAAMLLLTGCQSGNTIEDMRPIGETNTTGQVQEPRQTAEAGPGEQPEETVTEEALPAPTRAVSRGNVSSEGNLSDGTHYVLYSDGNLEISGGKLTVSLAEEEKLKVAGLDKITSVTLGEGVTSVGSRACAGLAQVKTITFGDAVLELGDNAAANNPQLQKVVLGTRIESIGESAFSGCAALKEAELPRTLKTLGSRAFSGCSALESIELPDSLETMGTDVFSNCGLKTVRIVGNVPAEALKDCTSVREVTLSDTTEKIGDSAFKSCTGLTRVNFGTGVTEIGSSAFSGCTALESVHLPDSLLKIDSNAFTGCGSLLQVAVPAHVTAIEQYAFQNCEKLNGVSFEDSDTPVSLGQYAFSGCTSLTGADLTRRVSDVGSHCFDGCTRMEDIRLGNQIAALGRDAFAGCTASIRMECGLNEIPKDAFKGLTGLREVILSEGVSSIGENAFSGCTGLESVTVAATVETIGDGAFQDCSALQAVKIPEADETNPGSVLKQVGRNAFSGCAKLQSFRFPKSAETIGDSAFNGCSALRELYIPSERAVLGQNVLQGCSNLTIQIGMRSIPDNAFRETGIAKVEFLPTVREIGVSAFEKCTGITEITLPKFGVHEIHDRAFAGCSGLVRIYIPHQIEKLGVQIFSSCEKLRLVAFEMSQEEFNKVDRGAKTEAWKGDWPGIPEYGYKLTTFNNEKPPKTKTVKAVTKRLPDTFTEVDPESLTAPGKDYPGVYKADIKCSLYSGMRYRTGGESKPKDLNSVLTAARVNKNAEEFGLYIRFLPDDRDAGYRIYRVDLVIREDKKEKGKDVGRRLYAAGCDVDVTCEEKTTWSMDFFPLNGLFDQLRELDGKVKSGKFIVELYLNGAFAGQRTFSIGN